MPNQDIVSLKLKQVFDERDANRAMNYYNGLLNKTYILNASSNNIAEY